MARRGDPSDRAAMRPAHPVDLAHEPGFRIGALEVRPSTRELAAPGATEVLEPRIMQVLVALARGPGQVVSRDDLITACWGGRAVGEDAINRCIQAIRRLAQTHGCFSVTTVARVGYRLDIQVSDGSSAAPPAASHPREARAERRHLTVLSCHLTRTPGLSARLDPEEWRPIATACRAAAAEAAERFGGKVANRSGDTMTVCFGYPEAQENAAERAVRAGLAIVEALAELSANLPVGDERRLQARIGVHAGVVVVAPPEAGVIELFGEAADLAAAVQAGAQPGDVVITAAVQALASGVFVTEPCGALSLDGVDEPALLFRAISGGLAGDRGFGPRETAPFVGREDEVRLLMGRWSRARDGDGQVVLVTGEPGIGKTRLVQEFESRIAAERHLSIACRGAQLLAGTPFHAVSQMLLQGLAWRGDETPDQKVAGLEAMLSATALDLTEAVPLVAELVGLPIPAAYPPLTLGPEERRKRLMATLAEWVLGARQPLLVVVEDLHWVDPSSLELLRMLVEQGPTAPLMLLCTARPEQATPWPPRGHQVQIALTGLHPRHMRSLVGGLITGAGHGDPVVDAVVRRADGVPLFAEELARLVLEGGSRPSTDAETIPATLQDSLAARLDRLGDARDVAQLGSVLGREFSYDLLHALSPMAEADLQAALARLTEAEVIHARGQPPKARYQFKHALIQDAAYAALLKSRRRELHARVAQTLTERFGGLAEGNPEVLARHWEAAADHPRAVAAWTEAAASAQNRNALVEAADGYRRARDILLATQPETPARDQQELDLGLLLVPLLVAGGVGGPEIATLLPRLQELAVRGGWIGAMSGMRAMAFAQAQMVADWPRARAAAREMRDFADLVGPAAMAGDAAQVERGRLARAMGHFCQFNVDFYCGELADAEQGYQDWLAVGQEGPYDQRLTRTFALSAGAQIVRHLGRADEARARSALCRAWCEETGNPFDEAAALALDSLLQVFLRDPQRAEETAARSVALSDQFGFHQAGGWAKCALGWARAQRNANSNGASMIRQGMDQQAAAESLVSRPLFLTLLAESEGQAGALDAAFASFDAALTVCPDEATYRPYTLICRGELSARLDRTDQAMADFEEAVAVSRAIHGLGYELRATVGLARLLQARGEIREARDRLAPLYARFTEGFDTRDLREAKGLLDALTATAPAGR
jgi:class 3 adenylate cyclase/tetratricopeptide (TPR) repeat protein